jgi:hypothetical protein
MCEETHGEPVEKDFGKWYDDFKDMVASGMISRRNKEKNAWSIPAWWFQLQAGRYAAKGEELGKIPHFVIMVTDADGKLIDTSEHRLWIRGFRSYESTCEDFPPIQWP